MRGSFALIGFFFFCILVLVSEAQGGLITDFTDDFAPGNWNKISLNSDGDSNFDGTSSFLHIVKDPTSGLSSLQGVQITILNSGTIKFDWIFQTTDNPMVDGFGHAINGTYIRLSQTSSSGSSGTFSVDVSTGDVFGFRNFSNSSVNDRSSFAVVGNFSFTPAAVPEPSTCILLGALLAGGGFTSWRMRKRKIGEGAA